MVAVGKHKNRQLHDQTELLFIAQAIVGQNELGADVMRFDDFYKVAEEIDQHPGKIVLFSNFPPDDYFENPAQYEQYLNIEQYGISKSIYREILRKRPDIHLSIVTGAQDEALENREIEELSPASNINVIRFEQFYYGKGFYENYKSLIFRKLNEVFEIY